MKTQAVRLLDVLVFGPLMIYAGVTTPPPRNWLKYSLIALGIGTILYNGRNYLAKQTVMEDTPDV